MISAPASATEGSKLRQESVRTDTPFKRGLRALLKMRAAWISAVILLGALLLAFAPQSLFTFSPTKIDVPSRFLPPTWLGQNDTHVFGTDNLGRDVFSRISFAARYTMIITVAATAVASVTGVIAGVIAGYAGGILDTVISRLVDILLSFPTIFLALVVLAVAGSSVPNVILVLALVDWAMFARVIRSAVISVRERDYVEAARSIGLNGFGIVRKHILPNVSASILVLVTHAAARILLVESSLSFLGLGVVPPATTWGTMVGDGRNYLYNAWWVATIPGAFIALTVLAVNFLGDALRDAFDPQSN